jgi:hypothetical protein
MDGQSQIKGDPLPWLLEEQDPGPRYLTLRDLVGLPADDPELLAARKAAHAQGPIAVILDKMHPEGYWSQPGPGYTPRYFSSVWSFITLAQMGASALTDTRISAACDYMLNKNLSPHGQFGHDGTPSGTIDCLQGNLCAALTALGYADPRLDLAYEWMARTVTGEGLTPGNEQDNPMHYYAAKCGPLFACGYNGQKPCAWGAAKVMLALSLLPEDHRTPLITHAITQGVDFLFSANPAWAKYPTRTGSKPSRDWWRFGFPVFYITDILQIVEALVGLGYAADPRLANALQLVREKQDAQGRWALEFDYPGKTWVDFGPKGRPNKWVTLRALRVLKGVEK